MRSHILFYLNGKECRVEGMDIFNTLANFLRYEKQATGTKVVCEEGDCGSCTVLIGRMNNGELDYKPVNSCIQYLYQIDCTHIVSIEGLKVEGELNAVQVAMVDNHGAQCGYCTPGFVVAMCSLFDTKKCVTEQDLRDGLTGNLCRCTGYEPILKAGLDVDVDKIVKLQQLYPSQDMLAVFTATRKEPVLIEAGGRTYSNPSDLKAAVEFKNTHPGTVIVTGGTDICVQGNKRGFEPPHVMNLSNLSSLNTLKVDNGVLSIGAKVTLAEIEEKVKELVPEFYNILTLFGSPQIKNAGTLAGNIANASPIADTLPYLFVMDAEIELLGMSGTRTVKIRNFYKGYKKLDMGNDELITQIIVPLPKANEILKLYKVSRRKNLDISTFTAAFVLTLNNGKIEAASVTYGGVGPVVLMMPQTAAFLTGRSFSIETFARAGQIAKQEITPISDVRGTSEFRNQLAEQILLKLYYEVASERELHAVGG